MKQLVILECILVIPSRVGNLATEPETVSTVAQDTTVHVVQETIPRLKDSLALQVLSQTLQMLLLPPSSKAKISVRLVLLVLIALKSAWLQLLQL